MGMTMTQAAATTQRANDVDKGWAWLVLVAVYSGIFLLSTSIFMCGVIYFALLTYYGENAAKTSVIGSLNSGLLSLLGPLVSIVMDTYSCRTSMLIGAILVTSSYVASAFVQNIDLLIFIFGVLGVSTFPGTGNALVSVPFVVVLAYYFEKRKKFVIALSQAVIGLAMFVASPLTFFLLDRYALKGMFLMTAGITAQLCCIALLCRPNSRELQLQNDRKRERKKDGKITGCNSKGFVCFDCSLLLNAPFMLYLFSTTAWNFMLSVCLMHLPNFMLTKGKSDVDVTLIMTIFGICNTSGRFISAISFVTDKLDSLLIHVCCLGVSGALTISYPLYASMDGAEFAFAVVAGIFTGGSNSLMTPITLDFVGEDRISDAHGLEYFFCGLGFIAGPPVAGYMYEVTSSYHYSFMMSGAVLILGCILAVAGAYLLRRQKCRQEDNIDDATELSEQQQHLFIPGHVKRNDFKEV
ncbi:monocarboxylate transporter 12-like isoform X4 [Dreissena polymorpha]|nr:monocarboxylate transporter 12-like isoform X4 [Dreissena polymorpha]